MTHHLVGGHHEGSQLEDARLAQLSRDGSREGIVGSVESSQAREHAVICGQGAAAKQQGSFRWKKTMAKMARVVPSDGGLRSCSKDEGCLMGDRMAFWLGPMPMTKDWRLLLRASCKLAGWLQVCWYTWYMIECKAAQQSSCI